MHTRLVSGSTPAMLVVLLSIWMVACDDEPPVGPPAPGEHSALQINPCAVDSECDGSTGGSLTDEDYASVFLAKIFNPSTFVALNLLGEIGASARHEFTGTRGDIEMILDAKFEGHHRHRLDGYGEYGHSAWDWISESLGYCSSYPESINGQLVVCPHEVTASINSITLGDSCGWSGAANSVHGAWMIVKDWTFSSAKAPSSDSKTQRSCSDDDGVSDSGPSGSDGLVETRDDGSDPAGIGDPTCKTYECGTWYWYNPDTGEIYNTIYTSCACTEWVY